MEDQVRKLLVDSMAEDPRFTFEDIGQILGVSRQRAHQIRRYPSAPSARPKPAAEALRAADKVLRDGGTYRKAGEAAGVALETVFGWAERGLVSKSVRRWSERRQKAAGL